MAAIHFEELSSGEQQRVHHTGMDPSSVDIHRGQDNMEFTFNADDIQYIVTANDFSPAHQFTAEEENPSSFFGIVEFFVN